MNIPPENTLVPDTIEDDAESALEMAPESTASLTSSILKYEEQNGRKYHALSLGHYPLPSDESEQERLDLTHHLWRLTLHDKLSHCPKNYEATRVLDIGTGTGIWALEFADEHPEAEVIGIDRAPIQPSWMPPNLTFEVDDVESAWTWAKSFDFIFCRAMIGSLENWPQLIKRAYEQLEPGGYLELQDHCYPLRCDDDTAANSSILKWSQLIVEATNKMGRLATVAPSFKKMMEDAGLEEVVETQVKLPINTWSKDERHKELGRWVHASHSAGLEGVSLYLFTQVLKWTREETLVFLAKVRKDLNSRAIHGYWPAYIVYGRKPK